MAPHLSARMIAGPGHLQEILARLAALGVRDVFAIAGDVEEPAGEFVGALDLLRAMASLGHDLDDVGVTGYPESRPFIEDDVTIQAMWDKRHYATYIVSQICFDGWKACLRSSCASTVWPPAGTAPAPTPP